MNKEEQQQNLYQILLQRNQYNYDIIRKYRKKSNQYSKKIGQHQQQFTIDLADTARIHGHVSEFVVEGSVVAVEGVADGGRNVVTDLEKIRVSRGEVGDKEILKLPSINANNHINYSQLRDSSICSTRRNQGVRTQISMSIISAKEKQTKAITQINEEPSQTFTTKQASTVPPSLAALPDPKAILKSYLRAQHTQNMSNTSNIALPNQNIHRNHQKRQSNASTSHKALLNLQEIVFEVANSNPSNNHNKKMAHSKSISNKYSNGLEQKSIDAKQTKKMRKSKQKIKVKEKERDKIDEKENVNSFSTYQKEGKRLTSLEGLQNLANALSQSNNQNANLSLSALTCPMTQKFTTKTATEQPCNNPDPIQKPQKYAQILPHIRKIKQLRINLHKIIRKDVSNLNDSTNHNYSFSSNGIASNINPTGGGQPQMQITNKMFKIQSVPVHQIRWM